MTVGCNYCLPHLSSKQATVVSIKLKGWTTVSNKPFYDQLSKLVYEEYYSKV